MGEWTSVDERLPLNIQSCIVYRKGLSVCNMYWDSRECCWFQDGYGFESDEKYTDITHWMPLPEPPK